MAQYLKCIKTNPGLYSSLITFGKEYEVINFDGEFYHIENDEGIEMGVPLKGNLWRFEFVNKSEDQITSNNLNTNTKVMKKTITKSEVEQVTIDLIEANGETTTLEVKNELRNRDFYAVQSEVSSLVNELVKDDKLKVTGQNGLYRTYELSDSYEFETDEDQDQDNQSQTVVDPTPVAPTKPSTPVTDVKHHDGSISIAKPIPQGLTKPGDWVVSSVAISDVLYFLGHLTRDEVRSAYAKLTKSVFVNTRSSRLV